MADTIWLSLMEVAELEDKSYSGIKKDILRGKLNAERIETGERCGFSYRVALSELSEGAQVRYYAKQKKEMVEVPLPVPKQEREVDLWQLSEKQREVAFEWEVILKRWREYIDSYEGKDLQATADFIAEYASNGTRKLSMRTLYRKWEKYKLYGTAALADHRGRGKGNGKEIPEEAWEILKWWYLDERQRKISYLYTNLVGYYEEKDPQLAMRLPSMSTFRRKLQEIPKPVVDYFREGKKFWNDNCAFFLHRDYSQLESNEIWTSDYHTLDLMVRDDVTGERFRPHLLIWADIKSRKILSMRLRRTSDAHGVFLGFREACQYGICDNIYVDNGREFLFSDFGGRGIRKTDKNADYGMPLLDVLGVKMINAKVANGRAKIAERQFGVIADQFSRLWDSYCGNSPENRPEGHDKKIKDDAKVPLLSEVQESLRVYIEGWYNNQRSKAIGLEEGSPNECFEKYLYKKRMLTTEQERLIMLRTERAQEYKRDGVFIKIGSTKVYFYSPELALTHRWKKVYVKYDPDDLSFVNIEDEEGRFIGKAERSITGGYQGADNVDAIKYLNKVNNKLEKGVKAYKMVEDLTRIPELRDVVMDRSKRMLAENKQRIGAKILEPVMVRKGLEKVSGGESHPPVDLMKMAQRAKERKGISG